MFFLPRKVLRLFSKLLIGIVLFAQGAIAVHACTSAERSQRFAVAESGSKADSCHEPAAASSATTAPASCAAHCAASEQRGDTAQATVPNVSAPVLLTVPFAPDPAPLQRPAQLARVAAPDPPIAIRFQVFRT